MQYQHIGYRIKGFYRVANLGHLCTMTNKDAQQRLAILEFQERHGKAAASEAFAVSTRTLYRWRQTLNQHGGNPAALAARSCKPKRPRQPTTPPEIVKHIRALRKQYPNLGKAKLHIFLQPWCDARNLHCPSASTIGRIIARAADKMRHAPLRITPKGKRKSVRKTHKTRPAKDYRRQPPLTIIACDTIIRMRDGIRHCLFTYIDPVSRFAIAFAATSASSRNATIGLDALCQLLPKPPRYLLSDNGSEFRGDFDKRLKQRSIEHWWTYPNSPKMNPHCERFNRTVQEAFVDYHDDLLFSDLALFNQKLAQWLVEYNTQIPHHGIALKTPLQYLLHKQPECQRYWTYTHHGIALKTPLQYILHKQPECQRYWTYTRHFLYLHGTIKWYTRVGCPPLEGHLSWRGFVSSGYFRRHPCVK